MIQKRYFSLGDEQVVLALLRKGYSFLETGNRVVCANIDGEETFMEAIPHTEPVTGGEQVILSQFLKGAQPQIYHVDSTYLG